MLTPTAPSGSMNLPWQTAPGNVQRAGVEGAVPSAGPQPELGRAAVAQAEASEKAQMAPHRDGRRHVPEIPPDPPPVKGLSVPALHLREVGDFDEARDTPVPMMSDLLEELEAPGPKELDIRV
ncbi:hypothetical protein [Roseicyclus sp.]|uniref:hypothetical protein n=1 Tax=Roseicyclus sp. TaxID=1914329 RepID=UPI003FA1690A